MRILIFILSFLISCQILASDGIPIICPAVSSMECHPFSDLIGSADDGGVIEILAPVPMGSTYLAGNTFGYYDDFCPTVCGDFHVSYTVESGTCDDCVETKYYIIPVPCISDGACDKLSCDITETDNCELTVTGAGGVEPYSFVWSSSETIDVITPTNSGVYIVTIMDSDGCMTTCSYPFNDNDCTGCNDLTVTIAAQCN